VCNRRGAEFAKLCIRNVTTFSGDSLSMAEEVLLSGDKDTALFQLDREVHRYGSSEVGRSQSIKIY